jgi:microcystin-dependent protein
MLSRKNGLISGIIIFIYFFPQTFYGQEVNIGNALSSDNALLNIGSDKGILLPRLTSGQRAAIPSPANGLIVYDIEQHCYYYYNSRSGWEAMKPVPTGTITMWYGDISTYFPEGVGVKDMAGWAICDGENETPDLRGKFVAGYSGSGDYATINGTPGGFGTVGLGVDNLPSHTHTISDPGHTHSVTLPANTSHTHTISYSSSSYGATFGRADDHLSTIAYRDGGTIVDYEVTTGNGSFSASMSPASANISLQNNGSGAAFDNRPPFYVLVYIMKL